MAEGMRKAAFQLKLCLIVLMNLIIMILAETEENIPLYKIEGKVNVPESASQEWLSSTKVLIDGGQYIGHVRSDGSFVINSVPSGSYIVEIANYRYMFEPQRVEISARGKARSRKLNNIQPNLVQTLAYPLRFRSRGLAQYFQQREQWRITDLLFNPMILMMILPMVLIMVMPKMMNTQDPEVQKEMQNMMPFNSKSQMPEMSEIFTNIFGGGGSSKKSKSKAVKKKS